MKTTPTVPSRYVDVEGLLLVVYRHAVESATAWPDRVDVGMFRDELHLACLRASATKPRVSRREMCNRIERLRERCIGDLASFADGLDEVIGALGGPSSQPPRRRWR